MVGIDRIVMVFFLSSQYPVFCIHTEQSHLHTTDTGVSEMVKLL